MNPANIKNMTDGELIRFIYYNQELDECVKELLDRFETCKNALIDQQNLEQENKILEEDNSRLTSEIESIKIELENIKQTL